MSLRAPGGTNRREVEGFEHRRGQVWRAFLKILAAVVHDVEKTLMRRSTRRSLRGSSPRQASPHITDELSKVTKFGRTLSG